MENIYHIAQQAEWEKAKLSGEYWPANPAGCPFIHFSFKRQLLEVANFIFAGRNDLLLLEVDTTLVQKELRIEAATGTDEQYPHLYRRLNLSEVIAEHIFKPSQSGAFEQLPETLR